jgi:phosphoribosylformylglycinamidine synthase
VGVVGLLRDVSRVVRSGFRAAGDLVFVLGPAGGHLGCSEYLAMTSGSEAGPSPSLDLGMERRVQRLVRDLADAGLLSSAQDCAEGGLAVALAESCLAGDLGFVGRTDALDALVSQADCRLDAALFGEGQSRVVVSCREADAAEVTAMARAANVPLGCLGAVGGAEITWGSVLAVSLGQVREVWAHGLDRALG